VSRTLDDLDRRLVNRLQADLPLVERPFRAIAEELRTTEADVLARVAGMKQPPNPLIRQIGAIFDSRALGYQSCLVAAQVDPARIAEAAAEVSRHPGVSHNYRREHRYNLWYTLAVPPASRLGLAGTVDELHRRSAAVVMRLMPSLKMYKIGVRFDVGGGGGGETDGPCPARPAAAVHALPIGDDERAAIRVLQDDLPVVAYPFVAGAEAAGLSVDDLLLAARRFLGAGLMRRFSAVLRHREVGFAANAMGAWIVPPEQHDAFGHAAGASAAVSHCYVRPTYPDWPYSLFTMVHGTTRAECEAVLATIATQTGVSEYAALYSTVEYKKTRVRYFTGDIEAWEAAAAVPTRPARPAPATCGTSMVADA
jgi:siroheme decarboxylase